MIRSLVLVSDARLADAIARMLRADGGDVEVGAAAVPALERLHARRVDALITDARLPGISRHQLFRAVRRLDPQIAIIALGEDEDPHNAHGVLGHLPPTDELQPLLDLVRVARRDRIVALVDEPGPASERLIQVLRQAGYAAVHAPSTDAIRRLDGLTLLAAIVEPHLGGDPMGAIRARAPDLPQIAISSADCGPPVAPLLTMRKPVRAALLLTVLDRLHRARQPQPPTA